VASWPESRQGWMNLRNVHPMSPDNKPIVPIVTKGGPFVA
jgi:hypothetical protein